MGRCQIVLCFVTYSRSKHIEHKHERESEKTIASGESNLGNKTQRSKIRCIRISVIQNCHVKDMFLHDKNNQPDNNYKLAQQKITNQITITSFASISCMQLWINSMVPS